MLTLNECVLLPRSCMPELCGWSMVKKWSELCQTTGLMKKKIIRWTKKGEKAAFLNHHSPQDDWMTFTLVKRKMTSGKFLLI